MPTSRSVTAAHGNKTALREALYVFEYTLFSLCLRAALLLAFSFLNNIAASSIPNNNNSTNDNTSSNYILPDALSIIAIWSSSPLALLAFSRYCTGKLQIIPSLPVRVTECCLGRISPAYLAKIIPGYFFASVAACYVFESPLLASFFTSGLSSSTLTPLVYTPSYSLTYGVIDFVLEASVNALFVVSLLVLPVLLRINKYSSLLVNVIVYPLVRISVDSKASWLLSMNSSGSSSVIEGGISSASASSSSVVMTSSCFAPNVLYALLLLRQGEEFTLLQTPHLFGPIFGGMIAGHVMLRFFPDADQ
jgi:hypothetical protein